MIVKRFSLLRLLLYWLAVIDIGDMTITIPGVSGAKRVCTVEGDVVILEMPVNGLEDNRIFLFSLAFFPLISNSESINEMLLNLKSCECVCVCVCEG